jgi:hypothetical protein
MLTNSSNMVVSDYAENDLLDAWRALVNDDL